MENKRKINQLLRQWPENTVFLVSWLTAMGYSSQLLNRYKQSDWIKSIGSGAVIKSGDQPTIEGALFALQQQAKASIHTGGKTALILQGKAHYLELSRQSYTLFGGPNEVLPSWILKYDWQLKLNYYSTSFLPPELGLVEKVMNGFSIKISGAARALMECLYLAPEKQDLVECYKLMEGLNNLRPQLVQQLLENCNSIKVKRLFLYMATRSGHSWLSFIDTSKIGLGVGKRQLVPKGIYIPKYQITLPNEFKDDGL